MAELRARHGSSSDRMVCRGPLSFNLSGGTLLCQNLALLTFGRLFFAQDSAYYKISDLGNADCVEDNFVRCVLLGDQTCCVLPFVCASD